MWEEFYLEGFPGGEGIFHSGGSCDFPALFKKEKIKQFV